jgi:hypothetical protein
MNFSEIRAIRAWREAVGAMPPAVASMFWVFAIVPLASFWVVDAPWTVYAREGATRAAVVVAAYWLVPAAICYAILFRHYLFLPLYILQCAVLLTHAVLYRDRLPLDLSIVRFVMVFLMGYVGVFFGNKDFLSPFLTMKKRFWRKAPRLQLRYRITLVGERPEHRIPAELRDVSSGGIAVFVEPKHRDTFIAGYAMGTRLTASMKWNGREQTVAVTLVRKEADQGGWRLGLESAEGYPAFAAFFRWAKDEMEREAALLHTPPSSSAAGVLAHDLHQSAVTLWLLFIALSFGLPAIAAALRVQ